MIWNFLKLEWKSFYRSKSFKFNIVIKVILGIIAVVYGLLFLIMGAGVYYALEEEGLEPFITVNRYLIYWWVLDMVFKYLLQKAPMMRVRPLLTMPISRKTLTHYLLRKSMFSFFNLYALIFFIPFSIVLLLEGYSSVGVLGWVVAMISLLYINNFLNLLVNNKNVVFAVVLGLLVLFGVSQYFGYVDITRITAPIFESFYSLVWPTLIVLVVLVALYRYNYQMFFNALYLDDGLKAPRKAVRTREFIWFNRFGLMGTFLKNDLKLLLRNKRSKTTLWMSGLFLLYGLIIFLDPMYRESDAWLIFVGLFVSGGFLFTFGGFVPSWDSAYYPLMMSQNIKYKEYLASKWWLVVVGTALSMILSLFYVFIDPHIYLAIFAGGLYNIGVNGYIVLLSGAYVKTPVDLTTGKKPFGDSNSFNMKTILLALPKIVLPIIIFYVFKILFGTTMGFVALGTIGLMGLLFRNLAFSLVESVYKEEKYDTLEAYKEKG